MSLFIDIIIILAAIAAVYSGIVKGFVKSVMGFVSLLLAIAAAFVFYPTVGGIFEEKFVSGWVSGIVETSLSDLIGTGGQQLELSKILADRPEALTEVASRFGIDLDELDKYYAGLSSGSDSEAINSLAEHIASPTAHAVSCVLAAIAVFLAALIALKLITFILDMICRLPVLSTLNKLLGLIFGVGSAAVMAWIIANMSVGLIRSLNAVKPDIFNESVINGSVIVKFFCENSLIIFK